MKIAPGTIYFVREKDRETGKLSDLVKIGLVNGNKSPWERLKDHQTGNPRKLVFEEGQFVQTSAVGYVEWLLHKTFASVGVGGEWFLLPTKSDVDRAVAKAIEIAASVTNQIPLIEESNRLTSLASTSPAIEPNDEIREKAWELALLLKQSAMITTLKNNTSKCFDAVVKEFGQEALSDQVEFTVVTPKSKFNPDILKAKYPKLFDLFQRTDKELTGLKLEIALKVKESDLPEDFLEFKQEVKERNELALASHNYYLLNENLVNLEELKGFIDWPIKVLEAELKVFCGLAEGVKGLYSWNRRMADGKPYLAEAELIKAHKDEYLDSFDTKKPSLRKKPIPQK